MDEQRILDENDVELSIDDIDFELGYLKPDEIFKEHHEAVEGQEREYHFKLDSFVFDDGSILEFENEEDPHIVVIDAEKGIFEYKSLEDEPEKTVVGTNLIQIEDKPFIETKEAWDEYEKIQRYKLYTQEELDERRRQKEQEEKQEELLSTGLDRIIQLEEDLPTVEETMNENIETINQNYELLDESLTETNMTVEDLVLIMADILGGEEEYPEEDTEPMQ